jgi:hypothetical protein
MVCALNKIWDFYCIGNNKSKNKLIPFLLKHYPNFITLYRHTKCKADIVDDEILERGFEISKLVNKLICSIAKKNMFIWSYFTHIICELLKYLKVRTKRIHNIILKINHNEIVISRKQKESSDVFDIIIDMKQKFDDDIIENINKFIY